jgi:hypothetical protein
MRGSCRIQRKGPLYETGSRLLPTVERRLRNMISSHHMSTLKHNHRWKKSGARCYQTTDLFKIGF